MPDKALPIRSKVGEYPFPTNYGNLVFPAGEYQALRIYHGEVRAGGGVYFSQYGVGFRWAALTAGRSGQHKCLGVPKELKLALQPIKTKSQEKNTCYSFLVEWLNKHQPWEGSSVVRFY